MHPAFSSRRRRPATPVARYAVTASSYTPTAGGTAVTISAQLLNANGTNNATNGVTVNWTKIGSGGSLSGSSSDTNGSGVATITLTVSTVAGTSYQIVALDSSGRTGATSPAIIVQPAAASKYIVTPATLIPAAGSTDVITAQLADTYGNAVPTSGGTITWSKTGSGGSFSAATSTRNSSGIATVNFTVATDAAVNHTVTATDGGALTGTSSTIDVVPGAIDHWSVTAASYTPTAGDGVVITAQALDQYDNEVAGVRTANWSETGGGTLATPSNSTDSSGEATNTLTTSATAGDVETVTVSDGSGHVGTSATITTQEPVGEFDHFDPAHFTAPHFDPAHFT